MAPAGRFIGTLLPCAMLVVFMSFMPTAVVRRIFPPFVPGVTIFLIGRCPLSCQQGLGISWCPARLGQALQTSLMYDRHDCCKSLLMLMQPCVVQVRHSLAALALRYGPP